MSGKLRRRGPARAVKRKLQRRAARQGRPMEEEIRAILGEVAGNQDKPRMKLATEIAELFKGIGLE